MRRDPRMLALYQKALQDKTSLGPAPAGLSLADRILACTAITVATAVFFWAYDALVHRDPIFVPSLQQAVSMPVLAAPEVPAPNMKSVPA